MCELLAPVGNFECLKAAVQNGADAVYFGSNSFSARAFANNFDKDELVKAIEYAKLRNVKTHLTINTLLKNSELQDALFLAKYAYEAGIDALIVQDLGLISLLQKELPDLALHASTQMSIHNLEGVLELQKMGFQRVVLSRELSIHEIEYICKNSNIEIECFVHGALCISYSGQCLFSSLVGGRSGNRGKCAQSCRLPYELLENGKKIDNGYLLSTRDLCSLEFLPKLISAGVKSFKIEGRMKSPEYVATVTRIYRKYIDLATKYIESNDLENYVIDPQDLKNLMQVFNRGGFSSGHLDNSPNKNLVFKEKPNNMGIFLGIVEKYNSNKGHITVKLNNPISIGDTISLQNETGTYTISELLQKNKNITETNIGDTVTIGRMKGNIKSGDKIYKLSSKELMTNAKESFSKEYKKTMLDAIITVKKGKPISMQITPSFQLPETYQKMNIKVELPEAIPVEAKNRPLEAENIILQITKTNNTPYQFKNIKVNLDDGLFLPKISMLNELRRLGLQKVEEFALSNIRRKSPTKFQNFDIEKFKELEEHKELEESNGLKKFKEYEKSKITEKAEKTKNFEKAEIVISSKTPKISVLLNLLNTNFDYTLLSKDISNVYIPLKFFTMNIYENIIKYLSDNFNIYIYIPTILKANYRNLMISNINKTLGKFNIKGFVISNIGNLELLNMLDIDTSNFEIVANYTLNVYNISTVAKLKDLSINTFTPSVELDKNCIIDLCNSNILAKELIVYGNIPLMNTRYCLLGKSNSCYPECTTKCTSSNTYELKDRLNMKFKILPDNTQTITTIFNCKTLSISPAPFNINFARIDILDENIDTINNIVYNVINNKRCEGKDFTNGNLNREI